MSARSSPARASRAYTASAHEERGLKHRPATETRNLPIPPELVGILRRHLATFGTASDGRIFSSDRDQVAASTAISDVWAEARTRALSPEQVASPQRAAPTIWHAAVSLWLNTGVSPQDVAQRAGHSVEVLLRVYAKCLDGGGGGRQQANRSSAHGNGDVMTLTYRQAGLYLLAFAAFYGSILGGALAYGQAQVQLQGWAALLLLIPMSGAAAITSIAYSVTARSVTLWNDLSFLAAWGLSALWLMWGAAIPTAIRRIRRGR